MCSYTRNLPGPLLQCERLETQLEPSSWVETALLRDLLAAASLAPAISHNTRQFLRKLKEDVDEENNTLVLFQKLKTILVLSAFKDEVSTSLLLLGVLLAAVRQCLTV